MTAPTPDLAADCDLLSGIESRLSSAHKDALLRVLAAARRARLTDCDNCEEAYARSFKVEAEVESLRSRLAQAQNTLATEEAERIRCRDGWAAAERDWYAAKERAEAAERQLAEARAANTKLHRRVQVMESTLLEKIGARSLKPFRDALRLAGERELADTLEKLSAALASLQSHAKVRGALGEERAQQEPERWPGGWLKVSEDESRLRTLLWGRCPCVGKYGDDGELQCACNPRIDYRRDTLDEIERKVYERALRLSPEPPTGGAQDGDRG